MKSRILFYHCGDDWIRGSEIVLLGMLERLDRQRFEPILVCNQQILADAARQRADVDSRLVEIPEIMWDGSERSLQFTGWMRTTRQLMALLRSERISLLYCNSGLPVQTGHYAARWTGVPLVCHLHCPYNFRYAWLYRFHLARSTVFVSEFIRKGIERKIRFRSPTRVIHNGVDVERFSPPPARDPTRRRSLGIVDDDIVLGQVGSLIDRKGIDVVIRSVAELAVSEPRLKLVLVGDGPQAEEYRALSRELGIAERVVFAGQQPDAAPFFREVFDINVLASRSEALGLSLLEGGACALPSLGADVEGIPEAVVNAETGLLFPSGDHESLASSIRELAGDAARRVRMGQRAREVIVERFSVARQVEQVEHVIADALTPVTR